MPPGTNEKEIEVAPGTTVEAGLTGDEVFLTSTSLCICGVRTVQGNQIGDGSAYGPITKALMDAYVDLVDYDWLGQYLKRIEQ